MAGDGVILGIIGAGRIGANHARILSGLPQVTSLIIADVDPARAEQLAASLPNARPTDVDSVFHMSEGLVIASPTDSHAGLLIRAAVAGLPTFCEKPIALDLESTLDAVTATEAAGITVQMGFQRRYDPGIKAIREHVASGTLGTAFLVRSQTHDPAPPPIDYIPGSGGIFKDCLIHDIDAVRYVTGQEIVAATAFGTVVGHPEIGAQGDFGTATAVFQMSGGTLAQVSGLRLDPVGYDVRFEAYGSLLALAAGWSERTPIISLEPGVPPPMDPIVTFWDRFDFAYRAELEAFLRVAGGQEAPACGPRDALENLRAAIACDRSATDRRTVSLEEVV
jgi:myo-inositol 2-dehydrogenase / D-chiro-inositol 1-dehydrogenase